MPTSNSLTSKPSQPFSPAPFKPPFWLTNPHLQSILPKFFAPKTPTYRRVVEKDSLDESDIAYDFYDAHPIATVENGECEQTPLIVLFHGMEGSSDSHYARALTHQMHAQAGTVWWRTSAVVAAFLLMVGFFIMRAIQMKYITRCKT